MTAELDQKPVPKPVIVPRWIVRTIWKVHRALFSATRGRLGLRDAGPGQWGMLRLTTVGRRTGQTRAAMVPLRRASTLNTEAAMKTQTHDRIVVESEKVGRPPREGDVLEVIEASYGTSYRVAWDDGHESTFRPSAGSARIVPAAKRATEHK